MGKLIIRKMLMVVVLAHFTLWCHGAVIVQAVVDKQAAAQVGANTAAAASLEYLYLQQEDSIARRAEKAAKAAAVILACKEAYHLVLKQTHYFGYESVIYKHIINEVSEIVALIPKVTKEAASNPVLSSLAASKNIIVATNRAKELVELFVKIVNNGKIENPFAPITIDYTKCPFCGGRLGYGKSSIEGNDKKVWYCLDAASSNIIHPVEMDNEMLRAQALKKNETINYLDAYDRVQMASQIYWKLRQIEWQLRCIYTAAKYLSDFNHALYAIDPETWGFLMKTNSLCDRVKSNWEKMEDIIF